MISRTSIHLAVLFCLQFVVTVAASAQIAITPALLTTFTNPAPSAGANFGKTVAALGTNRVLVGAPNDDTAGSDAGKAYLFSLAGASLAVFTNPTPMANERFGYAVAATDSNRVLISAPGDNTGANGSGAAYLFRTNGTLLATFTNPAPAQNANFGNAVAALDSDRIIIGAEYAKVGGSFLVGECYLFNTNGTLLTTFANPIPGFNEGFGHSIAAFGSNRVLIGAQQKLTGGSRFGAAYLFNTNGTILATFTNPVPQVGEYFGNAVAAVGTDRVLIGAYFHDADTVQTAGAAYLFNTNGTLLTTFTNPVPSSDEFFGNSVTAVGSNMVLIGVYTNVTGPRLAYLFNTNGTLLGGFTNPPAGDLHDNCVTAMGTDKVLIGAKLDDAGATDSGAVYLYQLSTPASAPRLDQPAALGTNRFRFRVTGTVNQSYTVQYATNLTNWVDLVTTNNMATNVFFFTDPGASNAARVYRLKVN